MKMCASKRQSILTGTCLAMITILALFLVVDSAIGGKPDKDPPLPGWIYYYENPGNGFKMTPDGGNVTPIEAVGEPSIRLHGGHRWILEFRPADPPQFYPNGYPRHDLYAVREDNAAVCAQLTDEFELEPDPNVYSPAPRSSHENSRWSLDDTKVFFLAKRWEIIESPPGSGVYVFTGVVDEHGLFELDVDWDPVTFEPSGSPTGLILDDLDLLEETGAYMGFIGSHVDVSHDRLKVIYSKLALDPSANNYVHSLYISEVNTPGEVFSPGFPVVGAENLYGGAARLSPDGTRIVFCDAFYDEQTNSAGLIKTVNTDGTGLTTIVTPPKTPGTAQGIGGQHWSPTGTHIIYSVFWPGREWWQHYQVLHRCKADGSDDKGLTSWKKTYPNNLGWRMDD